MTKQESTNVLIKDTKAGTIKEIQDHLEWLCLACEDDVHPGLRQSLHLVRQAVGSLKE